jgi:tRNA nucleotidyltransferase (CCA-adding enzyme)
VSELVDAVGRIPAGEDAEAIRRWLANIGKDRLSAWTRFQVARCRVGRATGGATDELPLADMIRAAREQIRAAAPLSVEMLAIDGRDLIRMGLRPGPVFGRILDRLLDRALIDPSLNTPDRLQTLARELAHEDRGGKV